MKKERKSNNKSLRNAGILLLILTIALFFRLYKINNPLADFFSWRQADTASVARNFVHNGFDILHPRYDDLSNIQTGQENPQGYRMVEFPLYNGIFALMYKTLPILPLEVYGRITSIFFSLILIAIIYYFLHKEIGNTAAVAGSLVYAVFPFFVFFSRVVLPDTTAISLTFISLFFLYLFSQEKQKGKSAFYYIMSILFYAAGILTKPTVIFYSISSIYLFYKKYGFRAFSQVIFYVYFVIGLIPFIWWRYHISFYPEGIPVSEWLITHVNTPQGRESIFFRPAFFRWIFYERINNIILGAYLSFIFLLGIFAKHKKYFFYSLLVTSTLYLFVFQGGNVQHEYYQIMILPTIAIFIGVGVGIIKKNSRFFISPVIIVPSVIGIFAISFLFSFYTVKDYYNYSNELIEIAKIIRYVTKPEDLIVTDTTGDTTLLYLSERRGAPAPFKDFSELKKSGYKYFVTQNKEVIENLKSEKKYPERFLDTDKFAIFSL